MIPKIVHLCWFGGGEYSPLIKKCLASIEEFLPSYQIMMWNEDNFDPEERQFTREAYAEKKYAFVSDVCRLQALKDYGGLYLDTDVEIKQSFDTFLKNDFFLGMESEELVSTAVIGSIKGHPVLDYLLEYYANKSFYRYPRLKAFVKKKNITPNTKIVSKMLKSKGFVEANVYQYLEDSIVVYPTEFFSPIDYKTARFTFSDNIHAIHHFTTSWK